MTIICLFRAKKKEFTIRDIKFKKKKHREHSYSSIKPKEKYRGETQRIEVYISIAKSKEYSWTSRKHRWKKEIARLAAFSLLSNGFLGARPTSRTTVPLPFSWIGLRVRDLFRHGMTLLADRSFEQSCLSSLARLKPPSIPLLAASSNKIAFALASIEN